MAPGKTLVSGATGHVGCEVVRELAAVGEPVVVTDLPQAPWDCLDGLDVEIRRANLLEPGAWDAVLTGVDRVIHTVGLIDISRPYEELRAVNYSIAEHLLDRAAGLGVRRIVLFSSASVCGRPCDLPIREDFPPEPKNDYERTKVLAEELALARAEADGPDICVLRPSVVYGPRGRLLSTTLVVLGSLLRERGWRVPVLEGGPASNWVHARDAARAAVFLLERGERKGIYHVANDDPLSVGAVSEMTFEILGVRRGRTIAFPRRLAQFTARHPIPGFLFRALNRRLAARWRRLRDRHGLTGDLDGTITEGITLYGAGDYVFSNERIKELGFALRFPTFRDSWSDTIEWYRENRWIPRA